MRPHAARPDRGLPQDDSVPARRDDLLGHPHLEAGAAQALGRGGRAIPAVPGTIGYGAAITRPTEEPSRIDVPAALS